MAANDNKNIWLNHFLYLTYKIHSFDFYRVNFIENGPLCVQIKHY